MDLTVKISLQDHTTEEYARKLGLIIASQIKEGVGNFSASPVDKVNVVMKDNDGNDLGIQTFA